MKNRFVAIAFAVLLGVIGAHKFYLGKWGQGILYIILSIITVGTVPAILGVAEGLLYLINGQKSFDLDYNLAFMRRQKEMEILTKDY